MSDLAGMIPLEIGNVALPNAPDWGIALGVSTAGFAAKSFTAHTASAPRVRAFTKAVLAQWNVEGGAEATVIVAWELAANAAQHALGRDGRGGPERAWLGLVRREEAVVCSVTDPCPSPPQLQLPDLMRGTGRGLLLVSRLSSTWGWSLSPSGTKTVWARVPTAR
ncbi:ATP-binding protein [Streptomyces katrae]|uniref:ATP-binding protein n=1 Tax=Streptomyces katrae TaxID=68223 RepID=A0ABT7GTV5_9ACTN|nr:ATP-binding protein [Streptomyces katrae]MDK9497042.1 ATP-binding protein [Streptomyces katrae]